MKKQLYIVIVSLLLCMACTPEEYDVLKFDFQTEQIKVLKIRTNSHILYADGISELKLEAQAFDVVTQKLRKMVVTADNDTVMEVYTQKDTIALANSRIPEGTIRYYKEDGTEIPGGLYKTTDWQSGDFRVYAKSGSVSSGMFGIEIRKPFTVAEKAVFPVIFHIIESNGVETPVITPEILQKRIERLNTIFARSSFYGANGGNPNLEFRLAEYHENGVKLAEKGIHRVKSWNAGEDLLPDVVNNTWSPSRYLNIWVCCYTYDSYYGEKTCAPVTLLESMKNQALPGLKFTEFIDEVSEVSTENPYHVGIVIGAKYDDLSKAYTWQFYSFDWEMNFGIYFGLLQTNETYEKDDYCSDTYAYSNSSMTDGTYMKESKDGYLYNSENIMDEPGQKIVISGEQAERIRWILRNCPSRWAYRTDFALTGK